MISSAYAIHKLTSISLLPPLHPQISKFSYVGQAHRSRSVAIDPIATVRFKQLDSRAILALEPRWGMAVQVVPARDYCRSSI